MINRGKRTWKNALKITERNARTKLVDTNTDPPTQTRFDEAKGKMYEILFGGTIFEHSLIQRHKN